MDFAAVLRSMRRRAGHSQRALAVLTGISARHLSWLETGRSHPSPEMVYRLGGALDLSLRDHNVLLTAAGLAPRYTERALHDPRMAPVRRALELLLRSHDPRPGLVIDRGWNIVLVNQGFNGLHAALTGQTLRPYEVLDQGPNVIELFFTVYRSHLLNFDAALRQLLPRLRREAWLASGPRRRLADWEQSLPSVVESTTDEAVVTFEVAYGETVARLFSTFTMLGTPNDLTAQEVSLELFHPADAPTADLFGE